MNQNKIPAMNAETAKPVKVHTILGSTLTGDNAIPNAAPNALVTRKSDITNDFILTGALVYAYSRPVIDARISLMAINQ